MGRLVRSNESPRWNGAVIFGVSAGDARVQLWSTGPSSDLLPFPQKINNLFIEESVPHAVFALKIAANVRTMSSQLPSTN
jgi:hypothetical protein